MTEMLRVPENYPPLMRPYVVAMLHGLWGWVTRPLQLVVHVGIPDVLGDEPQSAAALAAATGCNADALERFLAVLAACDIFERLPDGTYRHSPASLCLRRDSLTSAAASVQMFGMPVYQSALTNLEHTLRTGRPAIEALAPGGFFGYLRTHPDEARVFDAAMSSMSMTHNSSVVGAYDFSRSLGVIADIGGGQGALLQAILNQAPDAKGVLFDLPEVLAAAIPMERTQVVAGDFLRDPLPAADVHVLKLILHDWPDASALEILSAVRRAARRGGKLLVIETLLREGPEFNASLVMNISMLAVVGGRERTPVELQRMFEKTGFKLLRVIPTASVLQIVEAEAI